MSDDPSADLAVTGDISSLSTIANSFAPCFTSSDDRWLDTSRLLYARFHDLVQEIDKAILAGGPYQEELVKKYNALKKLATRNDDEPEPSPLPDTDPMKQLEFSCTLGEKMLQTLESLKIYQKKSPDFVEKVNELSTDIDSYIRTLEDASGNYDVETQTAGHQGFSIRLNNLDPKDPNLRKSITDKLDRAAEIMRR